MSLIKESKIETINIGKLRVSIEDAVSMVFLTAPCLAERRVVFHGTLAKPVTLDLNLNALYNSRESDHFTAIIDGDDILIIFGCGQNDNYRIDAKEFCQKVWDITLGKYEWLKGTKPFSVVPYSDRWSTYYPMTMPVEDQPVYCIVVSTHEATLKQVRFRNRDGVSCELSIKPVLSTALYHANKSIPVPNGYGTAGFTSTLLIGEAAKDNQFIDLTQQDTVETMLER